MNLKTTSTEALKVLVYDLSENVGVMQNNINVIMAEIKLRANQSQVVPPMPCSLEEKEPQTETVSDAKTVKKTVDVTKKNGD